MENAPASTAAEWPLADADLHRPEDPLLECLTFLTRLHQRPRSAQALTAGLPLQGGVLTPALFVRAAERAALSARAVRRPLDGFGAAVLPLDLFTT